MARKPDWMYKRPKDMTEEQRNELPPGPIQYEEGDSVPTMAHRTPIIPPLGPPIVWDDDDIAVWNDGKKSWFFGQWSDGSWYKQRI